MILNKEVEQINARRTFENLFKIFVVPIVNENDTTATSEIKYGDNDRLASRVAQMCSADLLILLSDINGLYSSDPNKKLIKEVKILNKEILASAEKKRSAYGSGGMATKLDAAKICMNSGCHMFIKKHMLSKLIKKTETGNLPKNFKT